MVDQFYIINTMNKQEALSFFNLPLEEMLATAEKVRKKYKGNKVKICSIINAKSGKCSENCKFCAQSAHHSTGVIDYPLVSNEKITMAAEKALQTASCFGIVSSGNTLTDSEINKLCDLLKHNNKSANFSASIGYISKESLQKLKDAGLKKIHHNLETSENFFANICTTHTYSQRVETIKRAKECGFEICSGGLFGIGESVEDRIDLAFTLKNLCVESVPMNFFIPIKGTALENITPISAIEVLKTISLFRMILQTQDITICGGREKSLKEKQSMVFAAGANGIMTGDYLTTSGRKPEDDLQMIKNLGLEI